MERKYSFPPVVDANSRILILGSIPGEESLRQQQYYANPRNQFWKIIFTLLSNNGAVGLPEVKNYDEKLAFLRYHGVALWDVIESCQRQGSLDTNIRAEMPNDFRSLFLEFPNIHSVFFNGTKARDTFRKKVPLSISYLHFALLPSTSPAHTVAWEMKLREWAAITAALQQ